MNYKQINQVTIESVEELKRVLHINWNVLTDKQYAQLIRQCFNVILAFKPESIEQAYSDIDKHLERSKKAHAEQESIPTMFTEEEEFKLERDYRHYVAFTNALIKDK